LPARQATWSKRLEQVLADTREQQNAVTELQGQLQAQLKAVNTELAALKSGQVDGGSRLDGQLKSLGSEVEALKQGPNAAIEPGAGCAGAQEPGRQPPGAAAGGASVQEFDAFRGQTTRSLNTLQSQIQNLQQINARPDTCAGRLPTRWTMKKAPEGAFFHDTVFSSRR
jgi:hypothetical protein